MNVSKFTNTQLHTKQCFFAVMIIIKYGRRHPGYSNDNNY